MKSFFHHPLGLVVGLLVATAGLIHAQPAPPTVSTFPASAVGATNATLNGTANPWSDPTSGWFEWGTTTNYGNVTPAQALGSGVGNTNFSQMVGGLVGGVTYHFRAVASNSVSGVSGANQSFTTPVFALAENLIGGFQGSAAWGDYDNDGRLDILQAGAGNTNNYLEFLRLWQNTGGGFVNFANAFGSAPAYSSSWVDENNDGLLDALLLTSDAGGNSFFRNTGSGFSYADAGRFDFARGFSAWGDFNNDGRPDVLSGANLGRNDGTNVTVIPYGAYGGAGFVAFSGAWGDYDNDGRLDILIAGETNSLSHATIAQVWRNTGNGFSNINAGLTGVALGSVAWGDYDNDGRLDILLSGTTNRNFTNFITQVWRNTGNGFSNINAGLPGVAASSVAWGDYDNDGRLDILLAGTTNVNFPGAICQIWRNTGTGFTNANAGLPGVMYPSVAWGDYDNDGRLDIFLCGQTTNGQLISQVWRNHTPLTNTAPAAPAGLAVSVAQNVVTFSWNTATDTQTPAGGLTYNLRIGTTPGGGEIVVPMAASNGLRRIPAMGNAPRNRIWSSALLPLGQPLYWSVQAVDSAFAGSPFASEQTLRLGAVLLPPVGNATPGDYNGDGLVSQSELDAVLANYFPNSPFLRMTNVAGLGGTNVSFVLSNSTAGAFSVEYTTNLTNWFLLGPATPRYLFTDTNAPTNPQRYYRLRWP